MSVPRDRRKRVFLGVMDIAGYYKALREGLQELGVKVHSIDLGKNALRHPKIKDMHPLIRFYQWSYFCFQKTRTLSRFNPIRYLWTIEYFTALSLLVGWISMYFDIVVLKSGIGLTANLGDLRFFRWARKVLVFIYHGSDSRPPYLNAYFEEHMDGEELAEWTRRIKNHVDKVGKYADYILDNPLSAHFQTRPICAVQCLGNLVSSEKSRLAKDSEKGGTKNRETIRILHAPSVTDVKGTGEIREVINSLKGRDYDIEYVEISGKPNATVIKEIAMSDIVVDELYSDTHGAMFAMEAAALGKPVLVNGYGKEKLDRVVPPEARIPTTYVHPTTMGGRRY